MESFFFAYLFSSGAIANWMTMIPKSTIANAKDCPASDVKYWLYTTIPTMQMHTPIARTIFRILKLGFLYTAPPMNDIAITVPTMKKSTALRLSSLLTTIMINKIVSARNVNACSMSAAFSNMLLFFFICEASLPLWGKYNVINISLSPPNVNNCRECSIGFI